MRRFNTVVVVVALATLTLAAPAAATGRHRCDVAPSRPTTLPPLDGARLAAIVAKAPDDQVSGMTVSIDGSAGCWRGTGGFADRAGREVPQDGRFRIGSMTKVFTAATALQLVAEGRLDLDRTVQHYLPDLLPASYPPITVRQVLTYQSGVNGVGVPHKEPAWFFAHRYDTWAPGSQLDLTQPLAFAPGTRQRYGNADYILAGLLIEAVSGRRWDQEVTSRIIRPLRLRGTVAPFTERDIRGPHAHGYEAMPDGRWIDVTRANPSLQWAAGSMISNAADLDRFLAALFAGRVVPARQLDLMFTVPDVPDYESGVPATNSAGLVLLGPGVWGKTGDRPGYTTGMGATRDGSRRVVYATNTIKMGGPQPRIAQELVAAVYARP
jgi:D-alanyl-D-alanine carboxypeptidase